MRTEPAEFCTFHRLSSSRLAYLQDHRVNGLALLPAAAMMEICLAAAYMLMPAAASSPPALTSSASTQWGVSDLAIVAPLIIPNVTNTLNNSEVVVQVSVNVILGVIQVSSFGVAVESKGSSKVETAGPVNVHARGRLVRTSSSSGKPGEVMQLGSQPAVIRLASLLCVCTTKISPESASVSSLGATAVAEISPGSFWGWQADGYCFFPGEVDSSFHLGVLEPGCSAKIPVHVGFFSAPAPKCVTSAAAESDLGSQLWASCAPLDPALTESRSGIAKGNGSSSSTFHLLDQGGYSRAVVERLRTVTVSARSSKALAAPSQSAAMTAGDVSTSSATLLAATAQREAAATPVLYELCEVAHIPERDSLTANQDPAKLLGSSGIQFRTGSHGSLSILSTTAKASSRATVAGGGCGKAAAAVAVALQVVQGLAGVFASGEGDVATGIQVSHRSSRSALGYESTSGGLARFATAGFLRTAASENPARLLQLREEDTTSCRLSASIPITGVNWRTPVCFELISSGIGHL